MYPNDLMIFDSSSRQTLWNPDRVTKYFPDDSGSGLIIGKLWVLFREPEPSIERHTAPDHNTINKQT